MMSPCAWEEDGSAASSNTCLLHSSTTGRYDVTGHPVPGSLVQPAIVSVTENTLRRGTERCQVTLVPL